MRLGNFIGRLILLLALQLPASAESYYFTRYDISDGLAHQTVYCAMQDSRGFMWFGTKAGLCRYDGSSFKTFNNDRLIPSAPSGLAVYTIGEAPDGIIWVGTAQGLYKYDPVGEVFTRFEGASFSIDGKVDQLLIDDSGAVWVRNRQGLFLLDINHGEEIHFSGSDAFGPGWIVSDTKSRVWILGFDDGCIHLYHPQEKTFSSYPVLTEYELDNLVQPTFGMACTDGSILVTTTRVGARKFFPEDGHVETLFSSDDRGNTIHIHTCLQAEDDEYWFGTEDGIWIYKDGGGLSDHLEKNYEDPYSISDNAIHVFCQDREGGIWVGSFFGGLNYLPSTHSFFEKYLPYDERHEIRGNVIRGIVPDKEGNLWVSTEDGGLCYMDRASRTLESVPNLNWQGMPVSSNVQCLFFENDDILWFGTYDEGIYRYDIRSRRVISRFSKEDTHSGLLTNWIVFIVRISTGKILVGTGRGLFLYDDETHGFRPAPGTNIGLVLSIYEDAWHDVWIGSSGRGLFRINARDLDQGGKLESVPFPSNIITSIMEMTSNRFLVLTEGFGAYELDRETLSATRLIPASLYPGMIAYRGEEDADGYLWLSTSQGLLRLDPSLGRMVRYTRFNGLPIDQFNYDSSYCAEDGTMFFGTLKGLVSFKPDHADPSENLPPVYLTGLWLNEQEVHASQPGSPVRQSILFSEEVSLSYRQSSFSLSFVSPTYSSIRKPWYRYRLKGVDRDWLVSEGPKQLYYTMLRPGRYTFEVSASLDPDIWSNQPTVLTIEIRPPFWKSLWAKIIYVFLGVTLAVLIIRAGQRRLENRKEKEILEAKIDFFTNITHEIRTPLTLITGSIGRLRRSRDENLSENENIVVMEKNVQRMKDLVNQLLDFRKIESSSFHMSFTQVDLKHLLDETVSSFMPFAQENTVDLVLNMPEEDVLVVADQEAVTKIISNMLSNAVKFCDTFIHVTLSLSEETDLSAAILRIDNDGERLPDKEAEEVFKPFHQFRKENDTRSRIGSGLGLSLSRSLAEMHGGSLMFDTSIEGLNSFVLKLPLDQTEPSRPGQAAPASFDFDPNYSELELPPVRNFSQSILVVEDDQDVRKFISEELMENYDVFEAANGRIAWEILEKNTISLVISDLMMPEVDGIELCRRIKNDLRFCHIPVIVLTAKVSMKAHLDALDSKADAFIEKPFSTDHLLAQVANLLANRDLLHSTFINSPYAHMTMVAKNNLDYSFLEKLNNYVMTHLSETSLSVDMLAEHMNMSMSSLYRKVKATTSMSPGDFIHLCRLKRAAEMLSEGNKRINEVASELGFSNSSYFASCFMKQFGMTPREFMSRRERGEGGIRRP